MKAVIFDLDGTLLETIPSILHHVNETLAEYALEPITEQMCRSFIGNGAKKLICRAFMARGVTDEDTVSCALARYNAAYDADPYVGTQPYEGVHEVLRGLCERGVAVSVVSNKPQPTVEQLLSHFFPDVPFAVIVGGRDDLPLKPDPAVGQYVMDAMGICASALTVVGDSDVDMLFAHAIGARGVGVAWGFRSLECLNDAGADVIARDARELATLLTV